MSRNRKKFLRRGKVGNNLQRRKRPPPPPPPPSPSPPVKGQRVEPVQIPEVTQEEYPTRSEPKERKEVRKVPAPRKGSQSRKPLPRKPSPRPFLKPPPPTKAQPSPQEERKKSRQVVTTPTTTTALYDDSFSFTGPEVTTESGLSYTDVGFDDDAASDEFRESDMPSKMPLDDGEDENQTPAPRLTSNSLREELKPRTVPPLRTLPLSPANRARTSSRASPTRSASLRLASNNENDDEDEEDDDDDDLLNDNRTPLSDTTEPPEILATTLSSLTIRPNSFMRARLQSQGQDSKRLTENSNLMFGDRLRNSNSNGNGNSNNANKDNEDNYDEIDDENEELNEDASNLSRKRRFEEFDSWEDDTGKDDDQLDTESSDKNPSVSPTSTTPSTVTSPLTTLKQETTTTSIPSTEAYELPISHHHHETRFRRFIVKPGRKIRLSDPGSLNLEPSI